MNDAKKQSNEGAAHVLRELEHETKPPQEIVPVDEQENWGYHYQGEVSICRMHTAEGLHLDEEVNEVKYQAKDCGQKVINEPTICWNLKVFNCISSC